MKEDLKCRSYRRQTSQILTEKRKSLRLIKSVRLLNKLKHPKKSNMIWFFSDEKNFCQDQVQYSQSHRWIATNNKDVPRGTKTKFPAMVMVFEVVSNEGHIMPTHIFEVDLKTNTKVFLDALKSVVIPWCNKGVLNYIYHTSLFMFFNQHQNIWNYLSPHSWFGIQCLAVSTKCINPNFLFTQSHRHDQDPTQGQFLLTDFKLINFFSTSCFNKG